MASADDHVPPFTLDKPRYDQSTYAGRWKQFAELVSPKWLLLTPQQIEDAAKTLADVRSGALAPGEKSDAELWETRQAYESAVHSQLGEPINPLFRMSAFVPVNIPICAGMLLAPSTLGHTIFWQWLNQSYNAGFNYANRNATNEQSNSTIFKSYATASFVSCATAVGLGRAVQSAKSLSPGARSILGKTVPFIAVASAGVFNAVLMRFNEAIDGIDVVDSDGEVRGRSVVAGRQSLFQVGLTRVALPVPILLLPPYLYEGMKKARIMPKAKYPRLAAELVVLTLCLWGALPGAVALFPQIGSISADTLEPEFRGLTDKSGAPIRELYYNKGV